MKRLLTLSKTLLAAAAVTTLVSASAYAQGGINLSWTECGAAGGAAKTFLCNSNTTTASVLVASAIPPVAMPQLNGCAGVLDLQTNQPVLSQWWHTESGGCRAGAITASFDFTTPNFTNCSDPWVGAGAGGASVTPGFNGPNRDRIRAVGAIPGSTSIDPTTPSPGAGLTGEYYIFQIKISNVKTVNSVCTGCLDGACIALNSVQLTQPAGVGDYTLTNPITRAFVTWQAGGGIGGQCPAAVPTQNTTWGQVKSIYR